MGFQEHSMSRLAIYLPSELKPAVKVLKSKKLLEELTQDTEDVLYLSKFQVYLLQPEELRDITYPDFHKWWRPLSSGETQKDVQQMQQQQLATAVDSNSDSDMDCIEKGDFCEYLSYATIRKRHVSPFKKWLQAHLHTCVK